MRWSLQSVLLIVGVVAVWLASLPMEHGYYVRRLIQYLVFVACLMSAIRSRGAVQFFWLGVVLTLVITSLPENWPVVSQYQPSFDWPSYQIAQAAVGAEGPLYEALQNTLRQVFVLACSAVAGLIGMAVFKHTPRAVSDS